MAQQIKLSTIAETLGISTATVSLALRDSPLVASATRDKIKEQARALGYIYNRRAASLRTSRSGIIGVVVHDIMNPFYGEILKAIESELDRSQHTFILSNHYDSVEKQRNFIETLLQLGGDGVIMSPAIGTPPEDIIMAEENGLPAVLIARTVAGADVLEIADLLEDVGLVRRQLSRKLGKLADHEEAERRDTDEGGRHDGDHRRRPPDAGAPDDRDQRRQCEGQQHRDREWNEHLPRDVEHRHDAEQGDDLRPIGRQPAMARRRPVSSRMSGRLGTHRLVWIHRSPRLAAMHNAPRGALIRCVSGAGAARASGDRPRR